jgi:hypothetical protein
LVNSLIDFPLLCIGHDPALWPWFVKDRLIPWRWISIFGFIMLFHAFFNGRLLVIPFFLMLFTQNLCRL